MNQTTEPVRTKYTSCPLCGVFKVSDGYNYGEQTCACGFGRRPTEEEIENDQFSISQVHNMLVDLFRLEQQVAELREAAGEAVNAVRFQKPEHERAAIDALAALLDKTREVDDVW